MQVNYHAIACGRVQGEEEQVQQLLQMVRQGTLWIQVDSLQTTRQQLDESLTRQKFSVQY